METSFVARNRWWMVRVAQLPADIFVFATLAFFIVRMLPGDPVMAVAAGEDMSQADIERLRESMGLGGSIFEQLLAFWGGLFTGDLGNSIVTGIPVTEEVLTRLPSTVELVGLGLVGALLFAFLLGFIYVRFPSGRLRAIIRGYGSTADAVPVFVLALFGIVLFYVFLSWAPPPLGRLAGGTLPVITGFPLLDVLLAGEWEMFGQIVARYVLPVGAIILAQTPNFLVQLISALDRELTQNTTRFQIASGASRRWTYFSVFRRSVSSVVVIFGLMFGTMLGGAVTLEQLFGFGGVGQLALRSVQAVDFPMLQGFLILLVAFCLVIYFLVDFVNMLLDPRRRPGVSVEG